MNKLARFTYIIIIILSIPFSVIGFLVDFVINAVRVGIDYHTELHNWLNKTLTK